MNVAWEFNFRISCDIYVFDDGSGSRPQRVPPSERPQRATPTSAPYLTETPINIGYPLLLCGGRSAMPPLFFSLCGGRSAMPNAACLQCLLCIFFWPTALNPIKIWQTGKKGLACNVKFYLNCWQSHINCIICGKFAALKSIFEVCLCASKNIFSGFNYFFNVFRVSQEKNE